MIKLWHTTAMRDVSDVIFRFQVNENDLDIVYCF